MAVMLDTLPGAQAHKHLGSQPTKFDQLCGSVQCGYALLMNCNHDLLQFKNEMLKHHMPSSVLLSLTLLLGKLYRSSIELGVSTNELVRLVRLYSTPWEEKSDALKKLHQDYESKQKKLEIALKRLEMAETRTDRMGTERRVMNWEKLFAKLVSAKSHGQRWRFLIQRFKEKLNSEKGKTMLYASDSDSSDENSTLIDDNSIQADDTKKDSGDLGTVLAKTRKHKSHEKTVRFGPDVRNGKSYPPPETDIVYRNDKTMKDLHSDDDSDAGTTYRPWKDHLADPSEGRFSPTIQRPQRPGKVNPPVSAVSSISVNSFREDTPFSDLSFGPEDGVENVKVSTIDKSVWTHEPDYDTFLHVKLLKPECRSVIEPSCSLVLGNELKRSKVFRLEDVDYEDVYKKSERTAIKSRGPAETSPSTQSLLDDNPGSSMQQFTFILPESSKNISFLEKSASSFNLKVAIHAGNTKGTVAMASINVLKTTLRLKEEIVDGVEPVSYILYSMITDSDRDLFFNQPCGCVRLICWCSTQNKLKFLDKATGTLSMDELIDKILDDSRREYLERCQSAGVDTDRKPIYTEEEMHEIEEALKEELRLLQCEYDTKLDSLLETVNNRVSSGVKPALSGASSPLLRESTLSSRLNFSPEVEFEEQNPLFTEEGAAEEEDKVAPCEIRKGKRKLKKMQWGKDLPLDFFERMGMFQEARKQHFKILQEKVRYSTMQDYMKKLKPLGRLYTEQSANGTQSLDDLCLPALFMPTKTKNLCTPKARSYFHMAGRHDYRLTQAPPIVSLPALKKFAFCPELVSPNKQSLKASQTVQTETKVNSQSVERD